jgi:cobyrinic acid a,c-diamide synthase
MSAIPRLVISAPSSGHGKTAVSVGLLAALAARGYRAAGFKIGPDYVDAAYLGLAAGRPGRNLDPRMVGANRIGSLFAHGAAALDIAVVEGTMGLFDGLAGRTDTESTAQISGLLRAPVVLVIDVGAMGQSVAALVHGFRAYDELLWLGGVILNRVASSRHEQLLREALDDIGVPVLGALRRRALTDIGDLGAPLPSRQHGMAPVAHGSMDALRAVRRLGEVVGGAIDIERTMSLARSAPRLTTEPWSPEDEIFGTGTAPKNPPLARAGRRPLIAVAGGTRHSFSYVEHTELLVAAGADVVTFDPLRDDKLPAGVDGLVVGAGLPEGYAEDLSFNSSMRNAVLQHAMSGRPIAAEGTGLLWLTKDLDGRRMCGVLDAGARSTEMIVLGYREAVARSASVLLPAGVTVVGHKMHHSVVNPRSGGTAAWTWPGGPPEGFVWRGVHASFLSLHWAGRPEIALRYLSMVEPAHLGVPKLAIVRDAPVSPAPVSPAPVTAVPHSGNGSSSDPVTAVPANGSSASARFTVPELPPAPAAPSFDLDPDDTPVLPAASSANSDSPGSGSGSDSDASDGVNGAGSPAGSDGLGVRGDAGSGSGSDSDASGSAASAPGSYESGAPADSYGPDDAADSDGPGDTASRFAVPAVPPSSSASGDGSSASDGASAPSSRFVVPAVPTASAPTSAAPNTPTSGVPAARPEPEPVPAVTGETEAESFGPSSSPTSAPAGSGARYSSPTWPPPFPPADYADDPDEDASAPPEAAHVVHNPTSESATKVDPDRSGPTSESATKVDPRADSPGFGAGDADSTTVLGWSRESVVEGGTVPVQGSGGTSSVTLPARGSEAAENGDEPAGSRPQTSRSAGEGSSVPAQAAGDGTVQKNGDNAVGAA